MSEINIIRIIIAAICYLGGFGFLFHYDWRLAIAVWAVMTAKSVEQKITKE